MMRGQVRQNAGGRLEAWVTVAVAVAGAGGELSRSEVVIDTGFTGALALPGTVIRRLLKNLRYRETAWAGGRCADTLRGAAG